MLCELLINTIKTHPSFDPKTVLPILDAQIKMWSLPQAKDRPDYHCLAEVWVFGVQQVSRGLARPEDVAEVLAYLIITGEINPFVEVHQSLVDSHLLTSGSEVSRILCERLRDRPRVIAVHSHTLPLFVRAVSLGFRWSDEVVGHGNLEDIAIASAHSKPEELLSGFQLASAMAADRFNLSIDATAAGSSLSLRAVCDGVFKCLKILQPSRTDAAQAVVSIIELERVVEGMVELLSAGGNLSESRVAVISNEWFRLNLPQGPLSHLRSYVALGKPLMNLVGSMNDAEVRRDIERIMEGVSAQALPGFPTITATSRRPSDLLRRLRYLVRCMVLKAAEPGAPSVFRDFRRDLFHGAEAKPELAAARIAFSRPQHRPGSQGAALDVRAGLANLVQSSGLSAAAAANLPAHGGLAALRCAVLVDIDTWSLANDGDTTDVPDAVLKLLREQAVARGLPANALVPQVFDPSVLASARDAESRGQQPRRHGLFEGIFKLVNERQGHEETLRNAVTSGLSAFRQLIQANFHREFDREDLHKIGCLKVFDEVDQMAGETDVVGNGKRCREWLLGWAFLSAPSPFVSAHQSLQDGGLGVLVSEVESSPYACDSYSGGSRLFAYADAAAVGTDVARQALLQLSKNRDAANFFRVLDRDAVGRSIGMALSQVCSVELIDQLFGVNQSFPLSLEPSVDGVTPVMAAVRFARSDDNARKQGLDAVRRCDGHAQGPDNRRDRRGWRAIHHAFAVGNVDTAKRLIEADPSCAQVQELDGTTFLIEAFRCKPGVADPAMVIEYALSLLRKMSPDARRSVFEFRGPIGMEGNPRSVVDAALRNSSCWTQFIAMSREFPDPQDVGALWKDIGAVTLPILLETRDFMRFAEYCDHVVEAGGRGALASLVKDLVGTPLTVRAALKVNSSPEAVAAQAKLWELRRHQALDIAAVSPFDGGNMFHALVEAADHARMKVDGYRDYLPYLHSFALQVLSGSPSAAHAAVQALDFDHESPIWKASRKGVPTLALAYARFLGAPTGADDVRWLLAARFIKDAGRYQDGIERQYQVFIDADRHLCLGTGGGESVRLSDKPLPGELSTRSGREWLHRNATAIANSLGKYIEPRRGTDVGTDVGTNVDVGAYSFINWLAHLASDSTQS